MQIQHTVIVSDAPDLDAESSFWAALAGGTVRKDDDWLSVRVDDQPFLPVQLAPDHVPPDWPDGTPQQIHRDLWVQDIDELNHTCSPWVPCP